MDPEKKNDFIIIGQGLAGSLLAWRLKKAGKKVVVIDLPEENKSSMVAAGLFNPVTGRRFVYTWKAEDLFPTLFDFYRRLAAEVNEDFFHPIPLFRPFLGINEKNKVIQKAENGEFGEFLDRVVTRQLPDVPLTTEMGGIFLKKTGYVDLPLMLRAIRGKVIKEDYYPEKYDENHLEFQSGKVRYKNISARMIIYCTGMAAGSSKYFSWLPFRPVKGELIHIKPRESLPFIFNRQIFIIPYQDGYHKVGATYDWEQLDVKPTKEARIYLEEKLKKFFPFEFTTIDQQAGIRPATKDRRPFIGIHPDIPQLGIFNGLGSKGVSLAPYFSQHFVDFLIKGTALNKSVNISRYLSIYKKSDDAAEKTKNTPQT